MDNEKDINEYLANTFGRNYTGLPTFRVSWADKQTEIRRVEYEEHYHGIFLRTVRGVEECKKYPIIKERWILERLIPPDPSYTNEIVSAKGMGSYECVYVFQDKDRKYLPLNQTVACIIVKSLLSPGEYGKRTENTELAKHLSEKAELDGMSFAIQEEYEELMKKDRKYPDGTRANLNQDGMKVFIP